MVIIDVLQNVNFGERVAEDESEHLSAYFVETDHWRRLYTDKVDIVYGPKGSGKSALYSLLIARQTELFDRLILIAVAENPRGATAFRNLVTDPPATEVEFKALWKLYFVCLLSTVLEEYGISNAAAKQLSTCLQDANLLPRSKNLQRILQSAFEYVKRLLRPEAFETGLKLDPSKQTPVGITWKIIFSEPTTAQAEKGIISVDKLLDFANTALNDAGFCMWILLDRLDVAFSESTELEQNALRALFHVYLDLVALRNIRIKVFLRTDIWRRITEQGFREASHITRHLTIEWNRSSLLNLIVKRTVQNENILECYQLSKQEVLATSKTQEKFFYRIFPHQIDLGKNKPNTLDWLLSRTRDSTGPAAPRELIHFLNSLRNEQIRRLEIGEAEPEDARMFTRSIFKDALPTVSRTKLEQTLYAENPNMRPFIEKLRGEKTQHSISTLTKIWKTESEKTVEIVRNLVEIGFFEQRGSKDDPIFWVPFLYRDALSLVQGAA